MAQEHDEEIVGSDVGGEQTGPPQGPTHEERPAGDSAEANDEISPHDLPKGHPGRAEAERNAADSETGTTSGNR